MTIDKLGGDPGRMIIQTSGKTTSAMVAYR